MLYVVLVQNLGHTPTLTLGQKFDSLDPAHDCLEIDRLVRIGAIRESLPEPAVTLELAGLTDKQLRFEATRLGIPDASKLDRPALAKAVATKRETEPEAAAAALPADDNLPDTDPDTDLAKK